MGKYLVFCFLSIIIILVSWRTLFYIKSHGFYRFLSWECIAWLIANNYPYWFVDPFDFKQVVSWIFLITSVILVIAGVVKLRKAGKSKELRKEKFLHKIEQTTELIDTGIYNYVRHPLYSSLVFLAWGIFLKNTTVGLLIISFLSTLFLYLTALFEEKECIVFFGEPYKDYMKKSKMFIPFLF